MGTNYYLRGHRGNDSPEYHIGKRSAAGQYCFDCDVSLCINGKENVHDYKSDWYGKCPICGNGRKNTENSKGNVKNSCSFSWAMSKNDLLDKVEHNISCPNCNKVFDNPEKVIENEYGELFTLEEFYEEVNYCPIIFYHMIDQRFS